MTQSMWFKYHGRVFFCYFVIHCKKICNTYRYENALISNITRNVKKGDILLAYTACTKKTH